MNKKIIIALLSVLSFLCSTIVFSQTLSFRCNFTDGQITNFDSGAPSTKHESRFTELVFDQIDTTKKTARLIGNVGVAQVQVIEGSQLIHLVEITGSGNLNLTSIFFTDKSKLSGAFPVVHSRHLKTSPNSPLPSQYIGLCRELLQ
jgi:hypothetical protein